MKFTNDLWESHFISMAGAEIRFQGSKEGGKEVDTLSVVINILSRSLSGTDWKGRERLVTCRNSEIERKEPTEDEGAGTREDK